MNEITANARMIVHCPALDVYEAFANPAIMTKFWFPKASGRLEEGREVKWYVGTDADAFEIIVHVKAAQKPHLLQIQWGDGDSFTDVRWEFESKGESETVVRICESGFSGGQNEVIQKALVSTGGFNQVITAAKALLEHNARMNVVEDHVA